MKEPSSLFLPTCFFVSIGLQKGFILHWNFEGICVGVSRNASKHSGY